MTVQERFQPLVEDAPAVPSEFRPLLDTGTDPPPAAGPDEPAVAPDAVVVERLEDHPAYEAGRAAVRAELAEERDAMQATLARSLEALAAFQTQLRGRYERELLMLALGVARKVVQQELAEHPEIWLTMIRSAVQQAVDRERILVRVPPALASFLLERAGTLRSQLEEVKELQIVDDPSLPDLGCIVESRYGEVDIGVETQLASAERALVGAGDRARE